MRSWFGLVVTVAALTLPGPASSKPQAPSVFDRDAAIAFSQAAIGRQLGDFSFLNQNREPRQFADYRGKPLVVNMVYTGCIYACPLVVQSLYQAVESANETLGAERFRVVTIGFDTRDDTPERMHAYAESRGIDLPNWELLSTDSATAERLADELGFLFAESPAGFEHVAQTTVVDADGRIYQHIYGADFEPPALVEPLKGLLMSTTAARPSIANLVERIRLFCTNYDSSTGRYRFDYSIFISLIIGGRILLGLCVFLVRNGIRIYRDRPTPREQS
jgi:protein SCO1/2